MQFHLPEFFFSDLVSTFAFGLVAILLIILGYVTFDKLTPKLDFGDLINKGNLAMGLWSAVSSWDSAMSWAVWFRQSWADKPIMEKDNKGKTIWEMLVARIHGGGSANGVGIAFEN